MGVDCPTAPDAFKQREPAVKSKGQLSQSRVSRLILTHRNGFLGKRGKTARVWSASNLLTLWRTSKIELTERVPSKWIPSGGTRSGGVETSQDTRRTRARSKATRPNRAALRQANVEPESGTAVVRLPPKRTASKKLSEVVIVIVS